jgi:hypothetical protein
MSRSRRSATAAICSRSFSHRDTLSAVTPMWRAKSTPDHPRYFLRKRISAAVSRLRFSTTAIAMVRWSCSIFGITTSWSPHAAQRRTSTPTRVTYGSPDAAYKPCGVVC